MRSKLIVLLLAYTIALLPVHFAVAQQPQADPIEQLKEQIRQMEAVDRDPSTSEEVRNLNRQFLNARRQQLRDLLDKRIAQLRAYQIKMQSTLTADEQALIETTIQQLRTGGRGAESLPAPADKPPNRPAKPNAENADSSAIT